MVSVSTAKAGNDLAVVVSNARIAQANWSLAPIPHRLRIFAKLRHLIAENPINLVHAVRTQNRTPAQVLMSEVIPVADAIKFLERNAAAILRPKKLGRRGRPVWLFGSRLQINREPFGVILIIAPSNYPLFLPATQALQALIAGNAVLLKPAPGHAAVVELFKSLADQAGLDPHLLQIINDDTQAVYSAIDRQIDKVVLTGSAETGRAVQQALAPKLIPSVMELSGHDAAFVLDDADIDLAARAIHFGSTYNGGQTCIAPKRVYVPDQLAQSFVNTLASLRANDTASPISIVPYETIEQAVALNNDSEYALGAIIFGEVSKAKSIAGTINAGVVVINDSIVPTADPRLPFGGRKSSGFGVTRGAEGLLEMTQPKAVVTRAGKFRPHYDAEAPGDFELFSSYLEAAHGASFTQRIRSGFAAVAALAKRGRSSKNHKGASKRGE